MVRKLILLFALALSVLVLQSVATAEGLPPASRWIPEEAILSFELSEPGALLDLALDPEVCTAVTSMPVYQQLTSQPGYQQFRGVISYLEGVLEADWRTGLRKLVGGGVTFAAGPQDSVLLIVDAEDAQLLNKLHEIVLEFVKKEAERQGEPERVRSTDYRGVTGWTFGGDEVHAIVGNRLVVSNKPEVLKAVLDLRANPDGRSLASVPAYQAAKQAVGPKANAMAFVNLGVLKQFPPVQQALTQGSNPMTALLFAGVTEAIRGSNWLAMGLRVQEKTLELTAMVDGKAADPSGAAAFALPSKPGQGAMPNLSVPRQIAGMSFYRDLHGFYAAKDDLFPERSSGLIFFENMMGIFFTGRDLTEEVFVEMKPEVRVVVAEQAYDPSIGTPQMQIPAFALVVPLHHPEEFAEVIEEAWQKALGLINFTAGQQARAGLIIDRMFHGDTKFSVASYSSRGIKDRTKIDSRFNFQPALAVAEGYLILSSTEGLTRDLIDALRKETADSVKPLAGSHSLVELDLTQLASILGANREGLVRQNMLGEGNTQQEAETQIDLLLTVLKHLGRLELDVGSDEGRPRASMELKLNLP